MHTTRAMRALGTLTAATWGATLALVASTPSTRQHGAAVATAATLTAGWLLMRAHARREASRTATQDETIPLEHHRATLLDVSRESFAAGVRATHNLVGEEYDRASSDP